MQGWKNHDFFQKKNMIFSKSNSDFFFQNVIVLFELCMKRNLPSGVGLKETSSTFIVNFAIRLRFFIHSIIYTCVFSIIYLSFYKKLLAKIMEFGYILQYSKSHNFLKLAAEL